METIPLFKVYMSPEATNNVARVLTSGFVGQGKEVEKFESSLKEFFKTSSVITVNSATSALHLSLHLLRKPFKQDDFIWNGLKDDDEVLTTPLTCTATNFPIVLNRLKIKWVDVYPNTFNLDLNDLENKLSEKTKVIMVVHWGGNPTNLDALKTLQLKCLNKFGFTPIIIEDCAHSFGSKYKNKFIGTHGNICCFSFQAIKHLTTGDGGAIVSPFKEFNDRAKLLRWYGINRETNKKDLRCEDNIEEYGFKFHMNDISATIGIANLAHIDRIVEKHRFNGIFYHNNLKNIPGVELLEIDYGTTLPAFWIYSLKVKRRDDFVRYMTENKIHVSKVHERNDKHSCLKHFNCNLPNLNKIATNMICIPVGWWVTEEDREYIVNLIKKGW